MSGETESSIITTENYYLSLFDKEQLFNFDLIAKPKSEFKHNETSISRIKEYYSDKTRHPMYGKTGVQSYLYGTTGLNHPFTGHTVSQEARSKTSTSWCRVLQVLNIIISVKCTV